MGIFAPPLLLAELSQLREVGGTCGMYQLLQVSPQHFNWRRVRIPFLWSYSFVVLLECVGSLSCCTIHFRPSFNSLTDGRRFWSRICWQAWEFMVPWIIWSHPGPEAEKQPQTFTWLICPENGLPKGSGLSKCSLAKLKRSALFFFWEQRLPSSNPPTTVMAIQFLSDCRYMHICPRCCLIALPDWWAVTTLFGLSSRPWLCLNLIVTVETL